MQCRGLCSKHEHILKYFLYIYSPPEHKYVSKCVNVVKWAEVLLAVGFGLTAPMKERVTRWMSRWDCTHVEVCAKDREPTVIPTNHRDPITEGAGAVRLTGLHGWKGPLDVVGGAEARLEACALCVDLLVSEASIGSEMALRPKFPWQDVFPYFTPVTFHLCVPPPSISSFSYPAVDIWSPCFEAGLWVFSCGIEVRKASAGFTLIYIPVICQRSFTTTARYADFDGSHSKDLFELRL